MVDSLSILSIAGPLDGDRFGDTAMMLRTLIMCAFDFGRPSSYATCSAAIGSVQHMQWGLSRLFGCLTQK